jgi:hypothetical protein
MGYYSRRRGLVGPAVLITIGSIFLAERLWPDFSFHRLWPLILIVIGIVRLLEMSMAREETVYPAPPPPPSNIAPPPGGSQ